MVGNETCIRISGQSSLPQELEKDMYRSGQSLLGQKLVNISVSGSSCEEIGLIGMESSPFSLFSNFKATYSNKSCSGNHHI